MGLKKVASANSLWRGYDYYKENKVLSWEKTDESSFEGIVAGSEDNEYTVHIDTVHPRKSECNCKFADGRRVVCKHMIALFFTALPEEAEAFEREIAEWEAEEEAREEKIEEYHRKLYKNIETYVMSLTEEEVREKLIETIYLARVRDYDDWHDDWDDDWDDDLNDDLHDDWDEEDE